jgi:hypothetical protein
MPARKHVACRICGDPHKAKGLCIKHYWRVKRQGSVYNMHNHTVNNPLGINQYTKRRPLERQC